MVSGYTLHRAPGNHAPEGQCCGADRQSVTWPPSPGRSAPQLSPPPSKPCSSVWVHFTLSFVSFVSPAEWHLPIQQVLSSVFLVCRATEGLCQLVDRSNLRPLWKPRTIATRLQLSIYQKGTFWMLERNQRQFSDIIHLFIHSFN